MRLHEWQLALAALTELVRTYGHSSIPLPLAMEALRAESRPTLYRRMDEMREAGYWVAVIGENFSLLAPDPND